MSETFLAVYVPPVMDDELRDWQKLFGCSNSDIILWCIRRGLEKMNTKTANTNGLSMLAREIKDHE